MAGRRPLRSLAFFAFAGLLASQARAKVLSVQTSAGFQQAIQSAKDGDTIQLAAGLYASPSNGFNVSNLKKGLTVRASPGAAVILDGGGVRPVLRFANSAASRGKRIIFRDIEFAHGSTASKTGAGGVTLSEAKAQFLGCEFVGNANTSAGAGGALRLARSSSATLVNCTFRENHARSRGGAVEVIGSSLVMRGGAFHDNGTNQPGHSPRAVGGAVYAVDSALKFTDVLFERNGSGWVGGGLYVFGTWRSAAAGAASTVLLERVTFADNAAQAAPGEPAGGRNEGGAIHAEDHTEVRIRDSAFVRNTAHVGGALHSYRAALDIEDSVFLANRARQEPSQPAVGGTIAIESNDGNGPSTQNGAINRPAAALALRRSLVEGPPVIAGARTGGCIFVDGDLSRQYGAGSVPKKGTLAENRASVLIERTVLAGCTTGGPSSVPLGGALRASLADLAVGDSLVLESRCPETGGGGGAFAVVDESALFVSATTFAGNFAERWGGAIFLVGSRLDVRNGRFLRNGVAPAGLTESRGAAIYSLPRGSASQNGPASVLGLVSESLFSSSSGLALWDVEPALDQALNDLRYDGNRFFESSFGADVYMLSTESPNARTPAELNALVVSRGARPSTDKSVVPNAGIAQPREGALLAVQGAGAPAARFGPYLAFAWDGPGATLDGVPLATKQGVQENVTAGRHTLAIAGAAGALTADVE